MPTKRKLRVPSTLRRGLYAPSYSGTSRFGLMGGQCRNRATSLARNAGWYNKTGEKLGWGDLSVLDARRIAAGLRKGELFLVLSEKAAWLDFVTHVKRGRKSYMKISPREKAPGKRYVADHATYVFAPRKLYLVDRYGVLKRRVWRYRGLVFEVIRPDRLEELIS
jgi:hypothetical protein